MASGGAGGGRRTARRAAPRGVPGHGSRADLRRALEAILENAFEYAPRGTTVVLASAPGSLEVLDEGPGLAPGEEAMVLERSVRGSVGRERRPEGTGLGLAIVRELVERWGGTVTIETRPEGGARVRVLLPTGSRDLTLS